MEPAPRGRRGAHDRSLVGAVVAVVALVVATPLGLGAVVGWYGINPPGAERMAPVGSEAHAFLDSFPASSLVVEVDYQSGWAPPAGAISLLLQRVNETCQKGSVTLEMHPIPGGQASYTDADLFALESSARHHWPSWSTMSVDYLFLGGGYAPDPSTIGLAYRGSSIAVFAGAIAADAASEYDQVIATVMIHEFGHELGLVGIVGSASNEDPQHPYHSNDPSDVMYWEVDSTALFGLFGTAPPTQFDAADLQDLSTVRGTVILSEVLPWVVLTVLVGAGSAVAICEFRRRRHRGRAPPTSSARDARD